MLLVGDCGTHGKSSQCVTGHVLLLWQILADNLRRAWILVAVQVGDEKLFLTFEFPTPCQ